MASSFDTYYINAESFSDATLVFTDPAMTLIAPNGTYQFNGVYRTMANGVLGAPFFCGACCSLCSSTFTYSLFSGKNEQYKVCSDVGPAIKVAMIVKFKFTSVTFPTRGFPIGLSATYDSTLYQGVSSNRLGYLSELYVGSNTAATPAQMAGTYSLNGNAWSTAANDFVASQDTTRTVSQSDVSDVTGNPDECYLLVPKLSLESSIDIEVYSPEPDLPFPPNGEGCDITMPCPTLLDSITVSEVQTSRALACSSTLENTVYVMRVNSSSATPATFDRCFTDAAGSFPLAEGYYLINGLTGSSSKSGWMHIVGLNGEVQSVGTCEDVSLGQPELAEVICSERRSNITLACTYQNQQGVNLPDQKLYYDGSGDEPVIGDILYSDVTGATEAIDGYYQELRGYRVLRVDSTANLIDGEITQILSCV